MLARFEKNVSENLFPALGYVGPASIENHFSGPPYHLQLGASVHRFGTVFSAAQVESQSERSVRGILTRPVTS